MIIPKTQIAPNEYGLDPDLIPEGASVTYVSELDAYLVQEKTDSELLKAEIRLLKKKIEKLEAGGHLPEVEPDIIPFEENLGKMVDKGDRVSHEGETYTVSVQHALAAHYPPATHVPYLFIKEQEPLDNPCEAPAWNPQENWNSMLPGMIRTHNGYAWRLIAPQWQHQEPGTTHGALGWVLEADCGGGNGDEIPEWSSIASHEFQNLPIGFAVMDEGTKYYLINPAQGHWQPSGPDGHHGWSTQDPTA